MACDCTCNATEVEEFSSGESGDVGAETESDEVEIAVLRTGQLVEGVDEQRHLAADQTRVDGGAHVIRQIGTVLPVDADHVHIALDN